MLPPEILHFIFKNLSQRNLYECQKVCRAWYEPANVIFLDTISLKNLFDLNQFLESFLKNATEKQLRAVKSIIFGDSIFHRSLLPVNTDKIKLLLSSFPCLTTIVICKSLVICARYFATDEFSFMLKHHCPRLQSIEFDFRFMHISELRYQLRDTLTSISIQNSSSLKTFGGTVPYIASFPLLKSLNLLNCNTIKNLEESLPIFSQLSFLETLYLEITKQDQDCVVERYLENKRPSEKQVFMERMANLKHLSLFVRNSFSQSSIKAIIKYLTGLKQIDLDILKYTDWNESQVTALCQEFLPFIYRRTSYSIDLIDLRYAKKDVLLYIVGNHFQMTPKKPARKCLALRALDTGYHMTRQIQCEFNIANLLLDSKNATVSCHELIRSATFLYYYNTMGVERVFETASELKEIDTLLLSVPTLSHPPLYDEMPQKLICLFKTLLIQWPSLKEINLNLPSHYDLKPDAEYPNVTHLKLQASSYGDSLLDRCILMFPCLRHLKLYGLSGRWRPEYNEFFLDLSRLNLERLVLDVVPVRIQTGKSLLEPISLRQAFFVLEVRVISSHQVTFYYRVSLDYLRITKIDIKTDLDGFVLGVNYIQVRILINSIEYINLNLSNEIKEDSDVVPDSVDHQDIVESKISFV